MRGYRFGDFELDLDAFELKSNGNPVKLERRPLDLLVLLAKQPGRMVTREEIIAALWPPKVIIDFDSGVNTLVRKVRNALRDSSESPRFIETVPGRGYRFIAAVQAVTEPASISASISAVPSSAPTRHGRPPMWIAAVVLLAVAGAGSAAWFAFEGGPKLTRIAVLPFENLTGDEQFAYLASGLAEDTSDSLAHIDPKNLRVIGASTRAFADPAVPIDEIGRRLGVDLVVSSSLRHDRSTIRVSSRLLRVADGEQIWSATFDRELTNVLGLQRELSIAIAEQIRLRLSPEVAAAIDRRQTENPAAYELYLKARQEWSKLTPLATQQSFRYFEQAAEEDPGYALAWAGLAFALSTSLRTVDADPAVVGRRALDALLKAERLGPDLVETQYARGYYELFYHSDARAAEKAARRAIELDPNNAQAHMLLGVTLPLLGENAEALDMMRRSRELEPGSALIFANSSNIARQTGDGPMALELAKQAVAIDPNFFVGHLHLGNARRYLGDLEGALHAYEDAARLSNGQSQTYSARISTLYRLGRLDAARALLAELTARAERQYVPPFALGVANALLGDRDAAFEWLNKAVDTHDVGLTGLPTNPALLSLHGDPQFDALLKRCGCLSGSEPPY
jgi:TolB-like protein/DNA-binding winged helix-turn-helix (wHTH) protein/tetratricopeptide (TPR) repeat protein